MADNEKMMERVKHILGGQYTIIEFPSHANKNQLVIAVFPGENSGRYKIKEMPNLLGKPGDPPTKYCRHHKFSQSPERFADDIENVARQNGWILNIVKTYPKKNLLNMVRRSQFTVVQGPRDWPNTKKGDEYSRKDAPLWISEAVYFKLEAYETESLDMGSISKVYHVTDRENLESILKQGLTPRSQSEGFRYPDRVYVWIAEDHAIQSAWGESYTETDDTVLLVIDPARLKRETTFHWDPAFGSQPGARDAAYYTHSPIPPNAIIEVKETSFAHYNEAKKNELRSATIKLAYNKPHLRPHLLPLLS